VSLEGRGADKLENRSIWAHFPPCQGGVAAASMKSREATAAPQTGWSITHHVSKRVSEPNNQGIGHAGPIATHTDSAATTLSKTPRNNV